MPNSPFNVQIFKTCEDLEEFLTANASEHVKLNERQAAFLNNENFRSKNTETSTVSKAVHTISSNKVTNLDAGMSEGSNKTGTIER